MVEKNPMQNSIFAIEVKPSTVAGYGVFATRTFEKGEVIEECPVIMVNQYSSDLTNYIFIWERNIDRVKNFALPLGYGCVYNHSKAPNAAWHCDIENRKMVFTAARTIYAGEEIFTYYGDYWFGVRGMAAYEANTIATARARARIVRLLRRVTIAVAALIALKLALPHIYFA